MNLSKGIKIILFMLATSIIGAGCTQLSRSLGDLTDNKYAKPRSGSVWAVPPPQLEPVAGEKKSVYVSFRNISDSDVDLTDILKKSAVDQGWKLVSDPSKATYRLRASLRFWGEVEPDSGGAGIAASMGLISGAAVGLGTAAAISNAGGSGLTTAAGAIGVGGLVGAAAANTSRPREWALICDFVLEEFSAQPVEYKLARATSSSTASSAGAASSQTAIGGSTGESNTSSGEITKKSNYFPHGIRLSVWSNQMNMQEEEAIPHINKRLEKVVRQMLPQ